MYKIGIGYDIHRLSKRRKLILGGVQIPARLGLLGHSDADALLHAICDALLGASGNQDIGEHFPDSCAAYKNISSAKLLQSVQAILKKQKYSIQNIDTIIMAEQPRLGPYKPKISKNIARILGLPANKINVKATTTEGLGQIGASQAIAAFAIALIKKP
ncbi:2-C-methyl-D-erythritol 2,4-cyclodiphosphate synthase [Candidatus Omnitrophota bacterium]